MRLSGALYLEEIAEKSRMTSVDQRYYPNILL
jgi:hypothetical protein